MERVHYGEDSGPLWLGCVHQALHLPLHPEAADKSLGPIGVPCKCSNVPRCRVFAQVARHAYLIRIAVLVQYMFFTDIYRSRRESIDELTD